MVVHNLGYPRIGARRELKKALEDYWSGKISEEELDNAARSIKRENLISQAIAYMDLIPVGDFSLYDHVLDTVVLFGAEPERFKELHGKDRYFAMSRGWQKDGLDLHAMEMSKWFNTNYHYIVPEFSEGMSFHLNPEKLFNEIREAKEMEILNIKPVLLGPISFLLLGKSKKEGWDRLSLVGDLMKEYRKLIIGLKEMGLSSIQIDEPFLIMDLKEEEKKAFIEAYSYIGDVFNTHFKLVLATYFQGLKDNLPLAFSLPASIIHIDLIEDPNGLEAAIYEAKKGEKGLSLGVIDGRNIWKADYTKAKNWILRALEDLPEEKIWIAPSCSLLHSPVDLDLEKGGPTPSEVLSWMSFAKQKLFELIDIWKVSTGDGGRANILLENQDLQKSRRSSPRVQDLSVRERVQKYRVLDPSRETFSERKEKQNFGLPSFPTTTIGSFPQTKEIRKLRADWKKKEIKRWEYERELEEKILELVRWQEEIGLDVLVHGEYERADMVEYFAEWIEGYAITKNGWVQSYGSRCVKPPVIFGDLFRPKPITLQWIKFASSLTHLPMKAILTGPVTMTQWSFVRDDQPVTETYLQMALAIRDEVLDLESEGIRIIQVDEPAIREGLPLRKALHEEYLRKAVYSFKMSTYGVLPSTQIHTHMCYSEFNEIMDAIAAMDADVITIETSRSQMELMKALSEFHYPNDIGPGVYDIHSPRMPSKEEMAHLLELAMEWIPKERIWVNPDCGLKTRGWEETRISLIRMVEAAKEMRKR